MTWIKFGIIWFFIWLIIATIFAPNDYSSFTYLISDLATSYHPYDYLMSIGFYGYTLIYFIGIYDVYKKQEMTQLLLVLIILSALSMFFLGIYDTNYAASDVPVYERTLSFHSIFAGGQEALFIVILLYHIKMSQQKIRRIHLTFLSISMLFSSIFLIVDYTGLFQRLIFINNGLWVFFYLNRFQDKQKSA